MITITPAEVPDLLRRIWARLRSPGIYSASLDRADAMIADLAARDPDHVLSGDTWRRIIEDLYQATDSIDDLETEADIWRLEEEIETLRSRLVERSLSRLP